MRKTIETAIDIKHEPIRVLNRMQQKRSTVLFVVIKTYLYIDNKCVSVSNLDMFVTILKSLDLYESFVEDFIKEVRVVQDKFYKSELYDKLPCDTEINDEEEPIEIGYTTLYGVDYILQVPSKCNVGSMEDVMKAYFEDLGKKSRVSLI